MALTLIPHPHFTSADPAGIRRAAPGVVAGVIGVVRAAVLVAAASAVSAAALVSGLGLLSSIGQPGLLGHRTFAVTSGSMSPTFDAGDMVLVRTLGTDEAMRITAGSVITFRSAANPALLVTHRVDRVGLDGNGGPVYFTKGDANAAVDATTVRPQDIIGITRLSVPVAGRVLASLGRASTLLPFVISIAFATLAGLLLGRPGRDGSVDSGSDHFNNNNNNNKGAHS